MEKIGVCLCCQALFTLAIVCGLAIISQQIDKLSGDFFPSFYHYITAVQVCTIGLIFLVGTICCLMPENKN